MPPPVRPSSRRIASVLAVVAVAFSASAASWLSASATASLVPVPLAEPSVLSATLESSRTAVPDTGSFGYTAHIRLSKPASYLQTRIRVRRPSGRLVFQRTVVANNVPAGDHTASFERSLEGIDLLPGAYPVELEVRADVDGSTETTELATALLVFDPAEKPAGVVLLARITAQPLEAPDGRFAIDPAVAIKARDDADAIASLILADTDARLTLSIAPALLDQWRRTADGYTMTDGTVVSAATTTPVSYTNTLDSVQRAVRTGRLEIVSTGLADPDLSQLTARGMGRDIAVQYQAGFSAMFASLETSPSTGTVPAGVRIPPATHSALRSVGVGYVSADSGCARSDESTVSSGSYPVANSSLRVLLSDAIAGRALSSAETTTALERIAQRQIASPHQPVVVRVELTDSGPDAESTVVAAIRVLHRESWARLILGRDTRTPAGIASVRLLAERPGSPAPEGYWARVSLARANAKALMAGLGVNDPDASSAQMASLLAQSSVWSEPDGTWAGATMGLQFAEASLKTSKSVLDTIGLRIEPVTLPSARGKIPVDLQNGTGKTLNVTMRTSTLGGIDVEGSNLTTMALRPQETFVRIPVNMRSALSGQLTVELLAGDIVVASRTVDVLASYLDRLVIIGGIVLALVILLAFIVRRVRKAELAEQDTASVRPLGARYTGYPTNHADDSEDE